ncbi:MAG: aminoglycoside 6-adenylyltransferase [Pseudomonadota bacterium]
MQFFGCCNEFWWVTRYFAKELWRRDLGYARHMLDTILRSTACAISRINGS